MKRRILLDTGPLVAFLDHRDAYHAWAVAQWNDIEPPLLSCEPVLAEACFLLQRSTAGGSKAVMQLIGRGVLQVPFRVAEHYGPLAKLMEKYNSVPMSLADACLVRMSELESTGSVLTLDNDFRIYRKHGRQVIPAILPSEERRH